MLEAALNAFNRWGYSATTLDEITKRSGVSVGSVYHHFGSKEGIAGALYTDSLWSYQRGLLATLRESSEAEQGIRTTVAHHLRWVESNRARALFLLRRRETEVAQANQVEVERLNKRLFAELEEWRRPLVAESAIRDLQLPLLYAIWLGPAQEYARIWLEQPRRGVVLLDAEPALADAAWAAVRSSR